jgi:hypothetical protein
MARVCKSDPDNQAPSVASSAGSSNALKGPGGGGKPRISNWKRWQLDILNKEYAADRNPSRQSVECVVARLEQTMSYQ